MTPARADRPVALRRRLRDLRRGLPADVRARANARICSLIEAHPWFEAANRVLAYRAFDGEPDVQAALDRAVLAGKQVLFAQHRRHAPLRFVVPWRWRTTRGGCPTPEGPVTAFDPTDLMLVPGVGFTPAGARLGLGGGHYDRTLAAHPVRSLGVAYACQLVAALPEHPWDQPVQAVICERGVAHPEEIWTRWTT